jgi:hypothetical protein
MGLRLPRFAVADVVILEGMNEEALAALVDFLRYAAAHAESQKELDRIATLVSNYLVSKTRVAAAGAVEEEGRQVTVCTPT